MEYCEGGDLFLYLKNNEKLTEDKVRDIGKQLAKGINYMHDLNIIHRDLKLGNILLTSDNQVKICDFGLAVKLSDDN